MHISDITPATKHDIYQLKELINLLGTTIMTAISDFAAAQATVNAAIDASLVSIQADVTALEALITTLQNSPGTISAEDQASLDAIQAHTKSVADALAALNTAAQLPASPVPTPVA